MMPGLTFSNELISRDEGMHCDFACLLYSKIKNRLPQETVHNMFKEAVEVEIRFIEEAVPVRLIGMNSELMKEYIEFVSDRLLRELGYEELYKSKNPFDFMNLISLQGKTNFFEKRVGDYARSGIITDGSTNEFSMDDDF